MYADDSKGSLPYGYYDWVTQVPDEVMTLKIGGGTRDPSENYWGKLGCSATCTVVLHQGDGTSAASALKVRLPNWRLIGIQLCPATSARLEASPIFTQAGL